MSCLEFFVLMLSHNFVINLVASPRKWEIIQLEGSCFELCYHSVNVKFEHLSWYPLIFYGN